MILVFDIGNTNIVFGSMENGELKTCVRLQSDIYKTVDEYAMGILYFIDYNKINLENVDAVMISSVVPQLTSVIKTVVRRYIKIECYEAGYECNHGLDIKLDHPREIGADRLMSALAAYTKYKSDCITVDFGTATTMEAVTVKGEFLGGTIFPGAKLALNSLHTNTAKLPMVDLKKPEKIIGTSTIEAIQSGVYNGFLCMMDGMIDKVLNEVFNSKDNVLILGTGGLGSKFCRFSRHNMRYEPDLVPYGLYCLYKRIKGQAQ